MNPTITALYAGLFGILYIVLCGLVVANRRRARVGLGLGSDTGLERAVRVHGNFAEYVPLFLVLLLLAELGGAAAWLLHIVGAVVFLARIAHAYGLSQSSGTSSGRVMGTLATWVGIFVLALANIWLALA
ncbi:MAG: MAPEG family protein [Gammaproteobacteria bacterium]